MFILWTNPFLRNKRTEEECLAWIEDYHNQQKSYFLSVFNIHDGITNADALSSFGSKKDLHLHLSEATLPQVNFLL
jgi:hypothetical protein